MLLNPLGFRECSPQLPDHRNAQPHVVAGWLRLPEVRCGRNLVADSQVRRLEPLLVCRQRLHAGFDETARQQRPLDRIGRLPVRNISSAFDISAAE